MNVIAPDGRELRYYSNYKFFGVSKTMKLLSTAITSPPDRENCVFEIWADSNQLAEITHEPGRALEIEIYPPTEDGKWNLNLEELMSILHQAINNLPSVE